MQALKITLGQFLDEWLETIKKPQLVPKTYELYSDIISLYLKPLLGNYEFSKLILAAIHKYYAHLRGNTKLSDDTFL